MSKRKYVSEFGINMFGQGPILLQQDALDRPDLLREFTDEISPHIYMIARRPRIGWDPTTLCLNSGFFRGVFTVQKESKFERYEFRVPHFFRDEQIVFSCPYPHSEYSATDKDGNVVACGKVALAMSTFGSHFADFLDLEILYIGQAYGDDGSRVAPDRLKSHSTLQNIYSEALRRSPDMDIWLLLWGFEPILIASMDGRVKSPVASEEEEQEHMTRIFRKDIVT